MEIGNRSVLRMLNRDKNVSESIFLHEETSEKVGRSFLCWRVITYMGFWDEGILEWGMQVQSTEFRRLISAASIKQKKFGIGGHNYLCETEQY